MSGYPVGGEQLTVGPYYPTTLLYPTLPYPIIQVIGHPLIRVQLAIAEGIVCCIPYCPTTVSGGNELYHTTRFFR